jgi:hypothetical protein
MHAQRKRQTGTSGLRLLNQQPLHGRYIRSRNGSATNYPRFDYLQPSAIQLLHAI